MTKRAVLENREKSLEFSIPAPNASPVCYLASEEVQESYKNNTAKEQMSGAGKDHQDSLKKKK